MSILARLARISPSITYPARRYLDWKVTRSNMVEMRGSLSLLSYHKRIIESQLDLWAEVYLPAFSLKGKTVLDVGAGCGETAWFFFLKGASRVIAIEPNGKCASLFVENATRNGWEFELHRVKFIPEHISMNFDFAKIDCEGGELALLKTERLKACRVELHPDFIGYNRVNAIVAKHSLIHFKDSIWGKDS